MNVQCTNCQWEGQVEEDAEQKCPSCGSTQLIEVPEELPEDYMGDTE